MLVRELAMEAAAALQSAVVWELARALMWEGELAAEAARLMCRRR